MFIWILLPSYMNSFVHQSPSAIPWLLFEFCHTCQIFLWMSDLRNLKMKVARSFYHMTNLQRAVYATYIDSIPYAIDNKNLPGSIPIYSPYNPLAANIALWACMLVKPRTHASLGIVQTFYATSRRPLTPLVSQRSCIRSISNYLYPESWWRGESCKRNNIYVWHLATRILSSVVIFPASGIS